jgi:uncharacterized protein (TIGR02145 family)
MRLLFTALACLITVSLSAQCVGPECCAPGTTWDTEQQLCVVFSSGDSNFDGCLGTDDLLGFLSGFGECNENSYDGPMFDCNGDGLITGVDDDCDGCPCEDHFDCHYLNGSGAAGYCDGCNCNTLYWGDCNYDGVIDALDDECIGGGDGGNDCECNAGSNWMCSHLDDYETYTLGFCNGCDCIALYVGDCNNDGEFNELDAECAVDEGGCDCSQDSDCAWLNDSETGAWGNCDGCNCNVIYYDPLDCNEDGVIDGLDNDCNGTTDGGGDCECESHFNCAHLNTETAVGVCDGCNCFTLEYGGLGGIIDCNSDGTIDGLDNDCNEVTDCNGDGTFNELDYDCLIELSNFQCGNDMEYAGYSYSTVQIGTQCWYAENNRYSPVLSDINDPSYTSPRYYEYVNSDGYSAVLYNFPAVNSPDICPSGWHMPIDDEWQQLEMALGMSASDAMSMGPRGNQGLQLKSTTGWEDNGNGNNSSGFNAFPDGFADHGYFVQQDEFGHFWSLTESSTNHSFGRTLSAYNDAVYRGELDNSHGYSSRCLLGPPIFDIIGCTNPTSCNYEPLANIEDFTCLYPGDICNDNDPNTTGDIIQPDCSCLGTPFNCGDDVNHENYDYSTVQIGSQCWFSENCRYLPSVSPSSEGNDTDPYYYVYGYDGTDVASAQATSNYATYGVLYNWPAVITEDICPSGWHIPSDSEFTQLTDFLGGESIAGGKMKEAGYAHWSSPNTGATNSSGFTGLPGGFSSSMGQFYNFGFNGHWWSASDFNSSYSWNRVLHNHWEDISRNYDNRYWGFSARCVRD